MWALKDPLVLQQSNFALLSYLFQQIIKVANENRPYISDLGFIIPDGEKQVICRVWVGAGANATPFARIEELVKENEVLKSKLLGYVIEKQKAVLDEQINEE